MFFCHLNETLLTSEMVVPLCINVVLSVVGFGVVLRAIPALSTMFIDAGLFGRDLCKTDRTKKV